MKRKPQINNFNPQGLPLSSRKRQVSSVMLPIESLPTDLPAKRLLSYTPADNKDTFSIDAIATTEDSLFRLRVDKQEKFLEVPAGTLIRIW